MEVEMLSKVPAGTEVNAGGASALDHSRVSAAGVNGSGLGESPMAGHP